MKRETIFIGYDPRETQAFAVAAFSAKFHMMNRKIPIRGLVMESLADQGLYYRPTERRYREDGTSVLIDELSVRDDYDGAMSTEFAISRFLVPALARSGWALFIDCDMLIRADLSSLFALCDDRFAVMCVKHDHKSEARMKMDNQPQTNYSRKNWSSVMLFNCEHPSNDALSVDYVNSVPGRDLHRFAWLDDEEIGALPPAWNWLADEQAPISNPYIVHHTLGSPCLPGYQNAPFADEWRVRLNQWGETP
jgi:lipopolysaccharide biosynthesis glycosyltransferase